jgi:hypothetical protein
MKARIGPMEHGSQGAFDIVAVRVPMCSGPNVRTTHWPIETIGR